jgi:hypothetical protein
MEGIKEASLCNSCKKHMAKLKGPPFRWSSKGVKHPKPYEKHGDKHETSSERKQCRNTRNCAMKWKVSCQINRFPESASLNRSIHMQLSARIENFQWLQQKTLQ